MSVHRLFDAANIFTPQSARRQILGSSFSKAKIIHAVRINSEDIYIFFFFLLLLYVHLVLKYIQKVENVT